MIALVKEYCGRRVIDDLSLEVEEGEIFGFLGPNGAGKSTAIRILTTLTKPTAGRALIKGFDVAKQPQMVKSQFGIVQQHLSLNRELTVRENLELHARLHHLSGWERDRRIDAVSYTHLRAHETPEHLVCRLLLEKKKTNTPFTYNTFTTELLSHLASTT